MPPLRRPPPSPWAAQRLWSGLSLLSKRSHRSYQADDERSEDDSDRAAVDSAGSSDFGSTMSSSSSRDREAEAADAVAVGPRYAGQDLRPTSAKELLGWYSYAFAAETYPVCAIGSFIPILLETLARENGVLLADRTRPCGSSDIRGDGGGQCVVTLLGLDVNTASFAMYTFSISVLLQALVVVSISGAADHGDYRKRLLLGFAWAGAASVMAYLFVDRSTYLVGAVLAIVSNTSFGASFVLLNSFLPLLVRHHPDVLELRLAAAAASHDAARASDLSPPPPPARSPSPSPSALPPSSAESDLEPLQPPRTVQPTPAAAAAANGATNGAPRRGGAKPTDDHEEEDLTSIDLHMSTQISTRGVGIGYSAALFVQCLAIVVVIGGRSSTLSLRLALLLIGAWWAIFTIPAALFLRPRPGPPLLIEQQRGQGRRHHHRHHPSRNHTQPHRRHHHHHHGPPHPSWLAYASHAWKTLWRTAKLARRLLDITLFLAAWFLLSDAIATTSSTAILFAKNELHMKPWALAMINVLSTTAGIAGAFSWSPMSRALGLKPHQTMLACIALFEVIPVYGLLGYLPLVRRWGVLGLQRPWEMYPLALIYGFVMGGLSAYSRSVYGELIPPGSEAAFYALYAITDKGSSVFGPAIVGAIISWSGGIRPAFWFLLLVVGLPAPLIYFVNVDRGRREGEKVARDAGGLKAVGLLEDDDEDDEENMVVQGNVDETDEEGDEDDEEEDDSEDADADADGDTDENQGILSAFENEQARHRAVEGGQLQV